MRSKYVIIAVLICVNVVIYTNSLYGDFVYDDNRQIIRNPLIQDPSLYRKALVSDVWAFKGDGTIAASNYWRPTFTFLNILAFQGFGLNPVGWHLLNILLHIGVCLLAFSLLCRWGASTAVAFACSLIFAVHPLHVESVSWIAGSPDLLFSLFLLSSIWFAGNYSRKKNVFDLVLAILFYSFSLGSKEVAILCFPIFWFVYAFENKDSDVNFRSGAIKFIIPFAAIAILYFVFRWMILGQISLPVDGAVGFYSAILSVPSVFLFYVKQMLLPITLGVNYDLRPLVSIDFLRVILPTIVSILIITAFFLISKRSWVQSFGALLFILPLLLVLNLTAFDAEQLVHDRYLYLPLLGFLIVIFIFLEGVFKSYSIENAERIVVAIAIIAAIPLGAKTFAQNQVWKNEVALWKNATTVDGSSSHNWMQLGSALSNVGELQKSVEAYNNSLDIKISALALMGRARGNLQLKRLEEAVWDLKTVTEMKNENSNAYTLYQTYEALAIAYSEQGKLESAGKTIEEARKRLPIYYAALTEKLAIINYQMGEKDKALAELEGAKTQAKVELLPESKLIFLRLGMLYAERGNKDKSLEALQDYLKLTSSMRDERTLADRKQAVETLKKLE